MKLNNIKYLIGALILSVGALMTGCEDDDNLPDMDALFRPIIRQDSIVVSGQYIKMSWVRYEGAKSYDLTITPKKGETTSYSTDTTTFTFEGLAYDTEYTITIASRNDETGLKSQPNSLAAITTLDRFTNLQDVRTIDIKALVSWNNTFPETFDKLVLFKPSYIDETTGEEVEEEVVEEIEVTDEILDAKEYTLSDLETSTEYIIRGYATDGTYLGKKKFKTAAPESYDGFVVDLRDLSEEDSYKYITDSLVNAIGNENVDQDIYFVLQGGVKYEMSTWKLPNTTGTITFVTGLTLKGNAIFEVTGNFNLTAGNETGGLALNKIDFTDHPSKPKTDGNYGGTYLVNANATATLKKLSILNSSIRYKRGIIRTQAGPIIEELIIDNCVADSIGGYGIITVDNESSAIKSITVTNSTFSHCNQMFVATKPRDKVMSLSVENCTFAYVLDTNARYMFNFDTMTISPIIKKCLFGPFGISAISTGRGYQIGTGSVTVDDCYATSDLEWTKNAENIPIAPLDFNMLTTNVSETFADPDALNFGVSNSTLKDNIGDPRWW